MSESSTIQVNCSCGKKLKAPAAAVGKKARCPACGTTLMLTLNPILPIPSPVPILGAADDPDAMDQSAPDQSALDDLARQIESGPRILEAAKCPQCGSELDGGAVLCTNCGYDMRTGKSLAGASVAKAAKSPARAARANGAAKPVDRMAPQGSLLSGAIVSSIFALAASILWIVCVCVTGYTVGYIAIAIGAAAGVGMQIGQKGYSRAGGYAAAAMTLGAILLAKLAVLELIVLPALGHPNASIFSLNGAALGYYFFRPVSSIIICIGMGAAFRTANGSVSG